MVNINDMTNRFTRSANVGNLVYVLLIVVILLLKPAGAIMV
jgi:hypothetical protein